MIKSISIFGVGHFDRRFFVAVAVTKFILKNYIIIIVKENMLIAEQPDVCDTVEESIMTDKLRKAILKLTDEEQLLIYRHYYAGISGTDLAEIYGVSQQAISKRIAKIRAKLKNLLEN